MYSSDPLCPNDFYLQQDFFIKSEEKITEDNFNPPCISNSKQGVFRCYHAGTYTISLGSNQSSKFQIFEKKKTYRWSFSIFERTHKYDSQVPTHFIEQGKNYTLRIWITRLSFDPDIQKELNCDSSSISHNSQLLTLSFHSLGEFPIVTFTEFDEYNVEPVIFNSENSYWEVNFTISNLFLRSLTIKGHDNSDIFDVVSQTTYNFRYKALFQTSSIFFSNISITINGHIDSINTIPCYPNFAIATVTTDDSTPKKKFYYTNDGFNSVLEFGKDQNFTSVFISINGIYYINNNQIRKIDGTGDHRIDVNFPNDDTPIDFFSNEQCDFYRSYGNQISYENKFIGVYSSKKIAYSYDGTFFKDDELINKLNLTFLSVSYKWQSLVVLAYNTKTETRNRQSTDLNKDIDPFIVNYDVQNHIASHQNLPFRVNYGQVKFGSHYGYFVTGNNLLFSPDTRSISSIFLPGHFESKKNTYITSLMQKDNQFILTVSDNTVYCGNYEVSKAVQLFDNPSNGLLMLDSQNNIVFVGINENGDGFSQTPAMQFIIRSINSYSKLLNGDLTPRYLDSGDIAVTNLTIGAVSFSEPSFLIIPPKNTILSYSSYSSPTVCSTLVTYINRHLDISTNMKTTSDFCTTYYFSIRTRHLSSYALQSRRGEGGEEGSTRLQLFMYSNGKVFDVYNLPLVFGCSPKRKLGIRLHKKICYPNENGNCVFTVFYKKYFKPIPLIFDDQNLIGNASFDFALISSTPVHYKMTVGDAECLRKPQTYEEMGVRWSRSTYLSCFNGQKNDLDDNQKDEEYTILNLTHNEVRIDQKNMDYVEFTLINLGPSSTMCQLNYTFRVKILEKPIKPGYIALIVIIACIIVVNAMFFEYWQFISFMFPEAIFEQCEKEMKEEERIEEEKKEKEQREKENKGIKKSKYNSAQNSTSEAQTDFTASDSILVSIDYSDSSEIALESISSPKQRISDQDSNAKEPKNDIEASSDDTIEAVSDNEDKNLVSKKHKKKNKKKKNNRSSLGEYDPYTQPDEKIENLSLPAGTHHEKKKEKHKDDAFAEPLDEDLIPNSENNIKKDTEPPRTNFDDNDLDPLFEEEEEDIDE